MNIYEVADCINPRRAQIALAQILAALGAHEQWSPDQLDSIAEDATKAWTGTGLPSFTNQDDEALNFWETVIDTPTPPATADPLTIWAELFGSAELTDALAATLNCGEAEITAAALRAAGNPHAAVTFMAAHLTRDTADGETHIRPAAEGTPTDDPDPF